MVLVTYSDSDSADELCVHTVCDGQPESLGTPNPSADRKRKADTACDDLGSKSRLPPLPTSFHSLYTSNVRSSTSDDPSLHEGRQRQIPHIQGNWPSHVYLEWFPSPDVLAQLDHLVSAFQRAHDDPSPNGMTGPVVRSFLRSDLGAQLPLHISLSAPLMLDADSKTAFHLALVNALEHAGVKAFTVCFRSVAWFGNFDKSRYFLVLRLIQPQGKDLDRLLSTCNRICKDFGLPQLYHRGDVVGVSDDSEGHGGVMSAVPVGSSSFHVSIAWSLDKPSQASERLIEGMSLGKLAEHEVFFDQIKVKIGNIVTSVPLELQK